MTATRVFIDPTHKKNKALTKAVTEAKKRPTSLMKPPQHPKVEVHNLALVFDGASKMYVYTTAAALDELPPGLDGLRVNHVEVREDLQVTPDFVTLADGGYADNTSDCRATVSHADEESNNGQTYIGRSIVATGPDLTRVNAYLQEVRHGHYQPAQ